MSELILGAMTRRSIPGILKAVHQETNMDQIRWYEDHLVGAMILMLGGVFSVCNLIIGLRLQDPYLYVLLTSIFIFVLTLTTDQIIHRIQNRIARVTLMSFAISVLLVTMTLSLYNVVGTVSIALVFLMILMSINRLDRILLSCICLTGFLIAIYLYSTKMNAVSVLGDTFYISLLVFVGFISIVGFLWNRVYKHRYMNHYDDYLNTIMQKEEITQLYEEVTATEEELRQQNEKLHAYTDEIRASKKKMTHLAYNDVLTGLPNRKMIIEKLNFLIGLSEQTSTKFALVFIDMNGLKKINDTLGHAIGDKYLKCVADRFMVMIDSEDTIGRFGGDEFALIVEEYNESTIYEYVTNIRDDFSRPLIIEGHKLYPNASFGISIFPDDAGNSSDLIKDADAAMIKAKENGKNDIQFYRKELEVEILNKIELEQELMDAYRSDEFFLMYQPQMKLNNDMMNGFEALIRWRSPKRGIVSPLAFIPILEETGLILDVGDWVLQKACEQLLDLKDQGVDNLYISINVSGIQFKKKDFVSRVKEIIKLYDIDPKCLQIELTESIFISDLEMAISQIQDLREFGISVALDDFGTGYSSLSYLKRLPIDVLKIDKSFIWDLEKGERERKIVSSVIDLVHEMGMSVVAEGVETDYQRAYLEAEEVDHLQGYLISHPFEADKVMDFIESTYQVMA